MVLIHTAIREDDNVVAVRIGAIHRDIQLLQCLLQRGVLVIKKRNHLGAEARLVQLLDLHQLHAGEDRIVHLQHGAVVALLLQKISVGADIYGGIRYDLLTKRVDGRVGYLRKELLKVVEQGLMLLGQHGQRDIMTHGSRILHAVHRHGADRAGHIVIGIAEHLVQAVTYGLRMLRNLLIGNRQLIQMQQLPIQPLTVGLTAGIKFLTLLIRDDALLLGIHQQHLARCETALCHNMLCRNIQNTYLRGENQPLIIGDVVAGRTQSVSIQGCTHQLAVTEENGSRAVPGLHHGSIIMIEILPALLHEAVVLPGLGNDGHHGERQIHAVHVQELQGIVQHGRIGGRLRNHREDLVDVLLQQRAGHGFLTGQHSIDVSADGVDLTVVGDHAVRMGPLPARCGIGGETGMHDGNGRLIERASEIIEELPQLLYQEHALVDNGSGGQRTDIGILRGLLKLSSQHKQRPVKFKARLQIFRPLQEHLLDLRHTVSCQIAEDLRMYRHLSPAQHSEAALLGNHIEHALCQNVLQMICGKKEHADTVIASLQILLDPHLLKYALIKGIRKLNKNTNTISYLTGSILTCTMLQLLHNRQGIIQHPIVLVSVNVYHRTDTTGIMILRQMLQIILVFLFRKCF